MKLTLEPADIEAIAAAVAAKLQPAKPPGDLLALDQCGPPVRTLRAEIRTGKLAAKRIGRSYYIAREDLNRWLESRRFDPASRPKRKKTEPAKSAAERALERAQRAGALRVVATR